MKKLDPKSLEGLDRFEAMFEKINELVDYINADDCFKTLKNLDESKCVKTGSGFCQNCFETHHEPEEYKVCEHITLKEWEPEVLEALKKTKICPLCEPVELPKEECRKIKCDSNNPFIMGDCNCEPKETSLRDGETKTTTGFRDTAYREWFTCLKCGNIDITNNSNFCPGCGRKIIRTLNTQS